MQIEIIRRGFTETSSSGSLYIDGGYFCETLEDAARDYGVKIYGKTCIPRGLYNVTITPSQRFGRPMILLYTNPKDLSCEHGGIRFTGVRVHGGNSHENTEGCPLVGFERISPDRIKKTAEGALFNRVKAAIDSGDTVTLKIRNEEKQ